MPDAPTEEEARLVGEHFEHLRRLADAGAVALAGRTLDAPHTGIVLIRGGEDTARRVIDEDPAIAAGVFEARLQPFRVALGGAADHTEHRA
jgi:uncharacterized protein YciI